MKKQYIKQAAAGALIAGLTCPSYAHAQSELAGITSLPLAYGGLDWLWYLLYSLAGLGVTAISIWLFWRFFWRPFIVGGRTITQETTVGPIPPLPTGGAVPPGMTVMTNAPLTPGGGVLGAPVDVYTLQTPYGALPLNMAELAGGQILTVGRSRSCNVHLPDGKVSAHHGIISIANGVLSFTDTGSSNGSFVNGQRLMVNSPFPLQRGSVLQLGPHVHIYIQ